MCRQTRYHSASLSIESPLVHISDFSLSRLPRIEFGPGVLGKLPAIARTYGTRALLVTGAGSLKNSPFWATVTDGLKAQGVSWLHLAVPGEPSPLMVDEAVRALRPESIDVVIGLGGGSALDAAKAIAGLLKPGNSVMDHLEGVGPELAYAGPATPFIAVPTTAGTGSEATKNAVLSVQGTDGFKKSFRDEKLVAEVALVDPDLLATCPAAATTMARNSSTTSTAIPAAIATPAARRRGRRGKTRFIMRTQPGWPGCRSRSVPRQLRAGAAAAEPMAGIPTLDPSPQGGGRRWNGQSRNRGSTAPPP